ncbi:hypothetical protein [Undibacterium sp.]|uniref:hypothetical protein n=1 Tax=Undibacterium sp. TaxID=1914977 RepID=UPI003751FAFC
MNSTLRLLVALWTTTLLMACGGGGSTNTAASTSSSSTSTTLTTPSSFLSLSALNTAAWSTQQVSTVNLLIQKADATIIAGATVGLYRYTTTDPSAVSAPAGTDAALTSPVATARIDYAISDTSGRVNFNSQLPAELQDVLVRVTDNKQLIDYVQVVSISSLNGGTITVLLDKN